MDTYQRPSFFSKDVGGIKTLNAQQTGEQIKILQLQGQHNKFPNKDQREKIDLHNNILKEHAGKELDSNQLEPMIKAHDKYNPVYDWADRHGLTGQTNSRYDTHYIHIDSNDRQIQPIMEIAEFYTLGENPITTTELTAKIFVKQAGHTFQTEDKITIDGVAPIQHHLQFDPTLPNPIIEFVAKEYPITSYMKINYPHGIPEAYSDNTYLSNLYIAISDMTNVGTVGNDMYYGNIPLTFINNVHTFFLKDTSVERPITYDANTLYINLPYTYDASPGTPTTEVTFFNLTFYYVNGLPMNIINAQYPTDIYHSNYYQVIQEVTSDGYYISVGTIALSSGSFGGKNVRIGKVGSFMGGSTEPNQYILPLERVYKNVVAVRMISMEIPNSENVIKSYPPDSQNNKLYWQNYEDGSHIYSLQIPAGKYNPTSLVAAMEKQFYDTSRYYYPSVNQSYTDHNYIQVTMDTDTDTTTFTSYKETVMVRPFVGLYYINMAIASSVDYGKFTQIPTDSASDPAPEYLYPLFIVIKFVNHNMTLNTTYDTTPVAPNIYIPDGTTGSTIIITGTVAYMGLPGSKIDGTYEAYSVNKDLLTTFAGNSKDYFMIKLQPIDIGQYTSRVNTLRGGIFNIYTPNKFRLLFDKTDTVGKLLGFPDVGETYAVTKYSNIITNKDAYQPDISPSRSVDATSAGNAIMLSGYNYVLMTCDEFPVIETIGKIKNAFAKIILAGIPFKISFNTNVTTPKIFYEPIQELTQLTIKFYSPDGDLYDFNGLSHSMTLEITTLDELPDDTHINTHTGKRL